MSLALKKIIGEYNDKQILNTEHKRQEEFKDTVIWVDWGVNKEVYEALEITHKTFKCRIWS